MGGGPSGRVAAARRSERRAGKGLHQGRCRGRGGGPLRTASRGARRGGRLRRRAPSRKEERAAGKGATKRGAVAGRAPGPLVLGAWRRHISPVDVRVDTLHVPLGLSLRSEAELAVESLRVRRHETPPA